MKRVSTRSLTLLLCGLAVAGAAAAATPEEDDAAKQILLEQAFHQKLTASPLDHGGCPSVGTISCPNASVAGSLASTDCHLADDSYADTYHFSGTAGQQVTIDLTAAAFDTFLILRKPGGTIATFDDDSGTGLNSRIVFTLDATGTWAAVANSVLPNIFGNYSLVMTCSAGGGGACVPNATALCLSNGRFRVETTYRTPQQTSGSGTAVPLTADSGYFWFFDSGNVEVVVKVLNACIFDPHIWVFAAGLTDVEVVMTVTDTRSGIHNIYTNPLGQRFVMIPDTSAFSTCP